MFASFFALLIKVLIISCSSYQGALVELCSYVCEVTMIEEYRKNKLTVFADKSFGVVISHEDKCFIRSRHQRLFCSSRPTERKETCKAHPRRTEEETPRGLLELVCAVECARNGCWRRQYLRTSLERYAVSCYHRSCT